MNMSIKDRVIPTLHGDDADRFLKEAENVEKNPHTIDYTKEFKLVKEYLKNNGIIYFRHVNNY